jgi:hypothetical protein
MRPCRLTCHRLVLVGDSDIARWPPHLLPFCRDESTNGDDRRSRRAAGETERRRPSGQKPQQHPLQQTGRDVDRFQIVDVAGRDGAVMGDVVEVVRNSIREWVLRTTTDEEEQVDTGGAADTSDGQLFVVVCAGENDVGSGTATRETVEHWSLLVEAVENGVMSPSSPPKTSQLPVSVVLLGPKLEPWLASDSDSRKCYVRLSRALEARCRDRALSKGGEITRAHFVDCLTVFCTPETANAPGALLGGRAMPDTSYFESDKLHLSEAGYRLWKTTVEDVLMALTNSSD